MSLRLNNDILGLLAGAISGGGSTPASYNWPAPVTAVGTGSLQAIALPEPGLNAGNVMVFVDGLLKSSGYQLSETALVITAPLGSQILIARYGAGPKGEKGPTGKTGDPYIIMGIIPDISYLPTVGQTSQGYVVNGHLFAWNDAWVDLGDIGLSAGSWSGNIIDGGNF